MQLYDHLQFMIPAHFVRSEPLISRADPETEIKDSIQLVKHAVKAPSGSAVCYCELDRRLNESSTSLVLGRTAGEAFPVVRGFFSAMHLNLV